MALQLRSATLGLIVLFSVSVASAQETPQMKAARDYAVANIKPWLGDPIVVNAIEAQNVETAKLKDIDINRLDIGWMDRSDKKLIDSKMNNALSTFLTKKKEAANGTIFEIFVFDDRGLNVGQTNLT